MLANLEKYDLQNYESAIRLIASPCIIGKQVERDFRSFFGGLPLVDSDFVWPTKKGYPLNFVGQLACSEIELIPMDKGYLLFFYDNRHWGYKPTDRGHAVVIHQMGERPLKNEELPETEVAKFFGWIKRRSRPRTYKKIGVSFGDGLSFPSWERKTISFDNEVEEECYIEFCCSDPRDIQIGGYPMPIQTDEMESDCVNALGVGTADEWGLLLQLFEIGDMVWGDAGALYWFIHKDDLLAARFDRVWMVTQCH